MRTRLSRLTWAGCCGGRRATTRSLVLALVSARAPSTAVRRAQSAQALRTAHTTTVFASLLVLLFWPVFGLASVAASVGGLSVGGGMAALVPHSRTLERPTLGSVRSFCASM